MGTRSLTVMKDSWPDHKEIVVMYRQWDGYPEGHGRELVEFLKGFTIVNGIGIEREKLANGGSCLAAQIVAHFKDGVGGFYLEPAGSRNMDEEFIYTVIPDYATGKIVLRIEDTYGNGHILYDGLVDNCDVDNLMKGDEQNVTLHGSGSN